MANSISYNGYDFATYYCYVTDDFELPQLQPKLNTSEIVSRHGGYLLNYKYEIREFTVPLLMKGAANAAAYYTAVDALNAILDIVQGEKQLTFDYVSARYLLAIPSSKLQIKKLGLINGKAEVSFKCLDPFWYSTTLTSTDIAVSNDSEIASLTPSGNADAYPIFTITPPDVVEGSDITIKNITANTRLTWAAPRALSASDSIVIDCNTWLVKLNGVTSMATLDHGSVFPVFIPGVLNYLSIKGLSGGDVNYTYRARWL